MAVRRAAISERADLSASSSASISLQGATNQAGGQQGARLLPVASSRRKQLCRLRVVGYYTSGGTAGAVLHTICRVHSALQS